MSNMGAKSLILIDRKCEITYQTQQAAASGQDGLQNRREYSSWDEFFKNEPDGIRLAFSARDGRTRPLWEIGKVFDWIKNEHPQMQEASATAIPVYLIFGPEDWGLANEDLELAHFNVNIPTFGDNSSLNLAQAVLLALYTLRLHWGGERTVLDGQQPERQPVNTDRATAFPEKTLSLWLQEMGFDLSKEVSAYTVLKRMMLHNIPTEKELNMLETVLQQSIRKLHEYNQLRQDQEQPL
jgi:tRNA/rRNA methyltransferase